MLRAADVLDEVRAAATYGIVAGTPEVDFGGVCARRDEVVATLTRGVGGLLRKHGVDVVEGETRLAPGGVQVGDRRIESPAVVLATGSRPRGLPGIAYGDGVIGTEEAWRLEELPPSLAIVGAGPSGVEFASAYARLGSAVTLLEACDQVLPGEDRDIVRALARGLRAQGVEVLTGAALGAVEPGGDGGSCTADPRQPRTRRAADVAPSLSSRAASAGRRVRPPSGCGGPGRPRPARGSRGAQWRPPAADARARAARRSRPARRAASGAW